jgi:hypothetical protein
MSRGGKELKAKVKARVLFLSVIRWLEDDKRPD